MYINIDDLVVEISS